jgi:hypothetical protein
MNLPPHPETRSETEAAKEHPSKVPVEAPPPEFYFDAELIPRNYSRASLAEAAPSEVLIGGAGI